MAIFHLLPLPFFTFIEDGALKQPEEATLLHWTGAAPVPHQA